MFWFLIFFGGFVIFALGFVVACVLTSSTQHDMLLCRKLQWQCVNGQWVAHTEIGTFQIMHDGGSKYFAYRSGEPIGNNETAYSDFASATEAAQANHDMRIRSRLVHGGE